MTMREIQDLTLQLERGLAAVERRFQDRAAMAARWSPPKAALSLRATAIPLSSIQVPGVPNNRSIFPDLHQVAGKFPNGTRAVAKFPVQLGRWRPILRGVLTEERREGDGYRVELQRDGLVEFLVAVDNHERLLVHAPWVMGLACSSLIAVERARQAAGTPTVEYGLELAISVHQGPLLVGEYTENYTRWGPLEPPDCVLPRYSVGDRSTFEELLDLIQRDFWNAAGRNFQDSDLLKLDLQPFL